MTQPEMAELRKALEYAVLKLGSFVRRYSDPREIAELAVAKFALAKLDQCSECGGKGYYQGDWDGVKTVTVKCSTCNPLNEDLAKNFGLEKER